MDSWTSREKRACSVRGDAMAPNILSIHSYQCQCGMKSLWFATGDRLPKWLKCPKCGKRMDRNITALSWEKVKGDKTMSSVQVRAKQIRRYFLRGDDYINRHNHKFDRKWEQNDGKEVAKEFQKLYEADRILQECCQRSSFFSPAMIGEKKGR